MSKVPRLSKNHRAVRAVDRAAAELRAGRGVLIRAAGSEKSGTDTVVAYAAERLSTYSFEKLRDIPASGPAGLALTVERAAVLHIPPNESGIVLLDLEQFAQANDVAALSDPTKDLDSPLRGPFRRLRQPVTAAVGGAVALCKRARLLPAAALVPVRAGESQDIATALDIMACDAADIERFDEASEAALELVTKAHVPLRGAENAQLLAFRPADGGDEHLAIVIGHPDPESPVLARLHSECFTGDLLASLKCDCGQQLRGAIESIADAGAGILIYLAQEGRGIGLINKLRAYRLQDEGFDTIEANERLGFADDERLFGAAAAILQSLGFTQVRLMTNNPGKVAALESFGITVSERVGHSFPSNNHNEFYLATKRRRHGHYIESVESGHRRKRDKKHGNN